MSTAYLWQQTLLPVAGKAATEKYSAAGKVVESFVNGGSMDRLLSQLKGCGDDRPLMVRIIGRMLKEQPSRERLPIALAICRHTREKESAILNRAAEESLRYL